MVVVVVVIVVVVEVVVVVVAVAAVAVAVAAAAVVVVVVVLVAVVLLLSLLLLLLLLLLLERSRGFFRSYRCFEARSVTFSALHCEPLCCCIRSLTCHLIKTNTTSIENIKETDTPPKFRRPLQRVAPDTLKSQFYLGFGRSTSISCERVALDASKSNFTSVFDIRRPFRAKGLYWTLQTRNFT